MAIHIAGMFFGIKPLPEYRANADPAVAGQKGTLYFASRRQSIRQTALVLLIACTGNAIDSFRIESAVWRICRGLAGAQ